MRDWVFDFLRNEFLKKMNISRNIIATISTIANMDAYTVICMILQKYGYAYVLKWVWWLALL